MDPGGQYHGFLLLGFLGGRRRVGDSQHVNNVTSQGVAQDPDLTIPGSLRVVDYPTQIILEVGVCIWVTVGKVTGVSAVREPEGPGKGVRGFSFPAGAVLVIFDLIPDPLPANVPGVGINLGVHEGSHAVVIETGGFHEVNDGKSVRDAGPRVLYLEVVPLSVAVRVQVSAQRQMVVVVTAVRRYKTSQLSGHWFVYVGYFTP